MCGRSREQERSVATLLNISLCHGRGKDNGRDGRWKRWQRDGESEEEVCDFGVGAGARGWGGCQLVLFPVDKTLRSLSLCRSLSLSYYAILSPLPPLLCLSLSPPSTLHPPLSLLLSSETHLGERKGPDRFKGKEEGDQQWKEEKALSCFSEEEKYQ